MIELEDYTLELLISNLLRKGVLLSGSLIFTGWISHFKFRATPFSQLEVYQPLRLGESLKQMLQSSDWGQILIYVGLFVLISLPPIRVVLTCFLFIRRKEHFLASICAVVLIGLMLSVVLGFQV